MDSFSSRAAFVQPDLGTLSPEAVRYLNALQRVIADLQAQIAALTVRVRALEP